MHFLFVPLYLGFTKISNENQPKFFFPDETQFKIDNFSIIYYFLHIIIKMNKAFYLKGNLVTSRKKILFKYMKLDLWIDIASLASFVFH
jgi:hypothetical protein